MQAKQEKGIMSGSAILGCLLTGYGMVAKNNVIFVIGLVGVVIAYLMFRRRLKEAVKKKDEVRRKNTGVRSQKPEDKIQNSESRTQNTEVRSQNSEDRSEE